MNNNNKGTAKYILAFVVLALFINVTPGSTKGSFEPGWFDKNLTTDTIPKRLEDTVILKKDNSFLFSDSIPDKKKDSTSIIDSTNNDSTIVVVDTFNVRVSKDSLDAPVVYHADDSMVLDIQGKKILLYGKESKVKYIDNELTAPGIEFDPTVDRFPPAPVPAPRRLCDFRAPPGQPGAGGKRRHGRAHHHPVGQGRSGCGRAAQGRYPRAGHAQRDSSLSGFAAPSS